MGIKDFLVENQVDRFYQCFEPNMVMASLGGPCTTTTTTTTTSATNVLLLLKYNYSDYYYLDLQHSLPILG